MPFDLARRLPITHPYRWNGKSFRQTKLWQPSDLVGILVAWYDAADASTITESGGAVSAWASKGPSGFNLSQATASKQPTLVTGAINGLNAIDFDDPTTPTNLATDGVADTITFAASVGILDSRDPWGAYSNRPTAYGERTGGATGYFAQFADNDVDGILDGFISGDHFLDGETTGASPGTRAAELQDGPTLHTRKTAFTGNAGICIGADRTLANRSWNGRIAEVVFLNVSTLATIQLVEGYLAWKWGTVAELNSGHPYKSKPPLL